MDQLDNAKEANAAILIQKRETRRKSGPQRPVVLSMVASRGIPIPNLAQLCWIFASTISWILIGFIVNVASFSVTIGGLTCRFSGRFSAAASLQKTGNGIVHVASEARGGK